MPPHTFPLAVTSSRTTLHVQVRVRVYMYTPDDGAEARAPY